MGALVACLCVLGLAAFAGSGASSAGADTACPNEAIRAQQHATQLGDCRAFEKVSPAAKGGGDINAEGQAIIAAADGNGAIFESTRNFADSVGSGAVGRTTYLARRGVADWSTHSVTPEARPEAIQTFGPSTHVEVFSADLERVFAMRSEIEEFCRGAANIEIVGRGAAYGGAVMSALCIREMSGFRVAAHTGAGFKHGPNLDVDGTHVAIIFALGRVAELGVKLAQECNRRGGKVVLVSTEERHASEKLFPVRIGAVAEPWEGITSLLVPQALTLAMVERNGCRLPPRFEYGVMEQ